MKIEYSKVEQLLDVAGIDFSVSFVHGALSAYACGDLQDNRWVTIFQSDLVVNDDQKNSFRQLAEHKQMIASELADSNFSFNLLINERGNIKQQVLSTREWTSGFWLGLNKSKLLEKIKDEDSLGFMRDLQQVSAMPLPSDSDKDSLEDLLQVQEYCRMGVIGLFLSLSSKEA